MRAEFNPRLKPKKQALPKLQRPRSQLIWTTSALPNADSAVPNVRINTHGQEFLMWKAQTIGISFELAEVDSTIADRDQQKQRNKSTENGHISVERKKTPNKPPTNAKKVDDGSIRLLIESLATAVLF